MAQQKFHDTDYQIKLKRGTNANIKGLAANVLGIEAEPAYTTDTGNLFVHDGSNFVPVSIGAQVFYENDIVAYENETVWSW